MACPAASVPLMVKDVKTYRFKTHTAFSTETVSVCRNDGTACSIDEDLLVNAVMDGFKKTLPEIIDFVGFAIRPHLRECAQQCALGSSFQESAGSDEHLSDDRYRKPFQNRSNPEADHAYVNSAVQTDDVEMMPMCDTSVAQGFDLSEPSHDKTKLEYSRSHELSAVGIVDEDDGACTLHTLDWKGHLKTKHQEKSMFEKLAETHAVFRFAFHVCLYVHGKFESLQEPPRSGILYRIITAAWFEALCCSAIIANSLMLGAVADNELKQLGERQLEYSEALELVFLCIYVVELLMKLAVHKAHFFCNHDMYWNIFDTGLVMLGVFDILMDKFSTTDAGFNPTFLRMVRFVKLIKIVRTVRVIRFFTQLRVLCLATLASLSSLGWCLLGLTLILYIFGLVFMNGVTNHLIANKNNLNSPYIIDLMANFGSLSGTMTSLYKSTTGGEDWGKFYDLLSPLGSAYEILFLLFVSFFMFAVMNIICGLYVQSVFEKAEPDDVTLLLQKVKANHTKMENVKNMAANMDADGDGAISLQEFEIFAQTPQMNNLLATLGIEVEEAELLLKMMLGSNGGQDCVDFYAFVDGLLRMKGCPSAADVHVLSFQLQLMQKQEKEHFLQTQAALQMVQQGCVDTQESCGLQARHKPKSKELPPSSMCAPKIMTLSTESNVPEIVETVPEIVETQDVTQREDIMLRETERQWSSFLSPVTCCAI